MPALSDADTIRILVATDNHVGCHERDPVRGDDSWKTFHEILGLAKERDVDMVLLAGDLFHDNSPSRKALYQVIRSLRLHCLGDRPCELEMLSDASDAFSGAFFNHVNYEDHDLNVAIPVFSIHGNHDDPTGDGHLSAVDLLQVSGLLNYFGRTPESDRLLIKPVLLQKGRTKLALYGMGNVRDERLHRTFRDGHVRFFRPSIQQDDWFNLMCVHQNRHAYSPTNYLPEAFLPDFLDLVIWGHEHECWIEPSLNPESRFHIIQPGSSIATSLVSGEAAPKHVTVLHITGREFRSEPIRLKTVRPLMVREIILAGEKDAQRLSRKENHRTELTRFLTSIVEEMIEQAAAQWHDAHPDTDGPAPLPLIRLRVEASTPEGGRFDCENPQRFSNRFVGKVANVNDVIQFYQKRKSTASGKRDAGDADVEEMASQLAVLDAVKVERLVREFLAAQSLTILPQNSFGDAVSQFVDKDDKHAMEMFVNESLENQVQHLMTLDADAVIDDEEDVHQSLQTAMEKYRGQMEERFSKGTGRRTRGKRMRFKPKPDGWDSEFDGAWEDQPGALIHSDREGDDPAAEESESDDHDTRGIGSARGSRAGARARGRARGGRTAAASTRKADVTLKKPAPMKNSTRGRRRRALSDDEDEDEDEDGGVGDNQDKNDEAPRDRAVESVISEISDDDSQALFVPSRPPPRSTATRAKATSSRRTARAAPSPDPSSVTVARASTRKTTTRNANRSTQGTINFASQSNPTMGRRAGSRAATGTGVGTRTPQTSRARVHSHDSDEDEDAFETAPILSSKRG